LNLRSSGRSSRDNRGSEEEKSEDGLDLHFRFKSSTGEVIREVSKRVDSVCNGEAEEDVAVLDIV
jgi:hypothetical protein